MIVDLARSAIAADLDLRGVLLLSLLVAPPPRPNTNSVRISTLARSSKLPMSTASRIIWILRQQGLVEVSLDRADRRVRYAALTKRGAQLVAQLQLAATSASKSA